MYHLHKIKAASESKKSRKGVSVVEARQGVPLPAYVLVTKDLGDAGTGLQVVRRSDAALLAEWVETPRGFEPRLTRLALDCDMTLLLQNLKAGQCSLDYTYSLRKTNAVGALCCPVTGGGYGG